MIREILTSQSQQTLQHISFILQFSSFGTNWVALAQKAILVDSPLQITLAYSFSYLSCLYPISLATSL